MKSKVQKFNETFLRETRGDSWVEGLKQMALSYSKELAKKEELTKKGKNAIMR